MLMTTVVGSRLDLGAFGTSRASNRRLDQTMAEDGTEVIRLLIGQCERQSDVHQSHEMVVSRDGVANLVGPVMPATGEPDW